MTNPKNRMISQKIRKRINMMKKTLKKVIKIKKEKRTIKKKIPRIPKKRTTKRMMKKMRNKKMMMMMKRIGKLRIVLKKGKDKV